MVLNRWDPLFEIRQARRLANRRWAGFPAAFAGHFDNAENRDWSIPLDIAKDGDNITVQANLPGVRPEDIDVTIENGILTIKAETKSAQEQNEERQPQNANQGLAPSLRLVWTSVF